MHDRHDLTDEQWKILEPFLPDRTPVRGGQWKDHRQVINGVMWRTRAGQDVSAERLAPTVLEESVRPGRHTGGAGE